MSVEGTGQATGLWPDYPVALRLADRQVLLVGAGRIAEGRAHQLLEAGARVHLIAPQATEGLRRLAAEGRLRLSERPYEPGDCAGSLVVFAASDRPEVNRAVVEEARGRGILANAADMPELCDFYVPSMGRQGPVVVAVSTSGQAPALARALRERLMAHVGPEYSELARLLSRLRRVLPPGPRRKAAFESIIHSGAAELLRSGQRAALTQLLRGLFKPAREAEPPQAPGGAP